MTQKGLTYRICMGIAGAGLILFILAALVNMIYIPRTELVSDCTYEIQHNDSGPICQKLHETQGMIRYLAVTGLIFMFLFSTAAWISERRRLRKR